ncbi:hypothetical protein PFDG_05277 [Plasmodium falciparum Dd2]|uniref:Uncharacterized protein n=1 Tax=Plasmodium falciparum (isolate Dd2) TaxID=57267 RepID=A0A0L7MA40_PLAF4|nr:hypothetical protein PFDG_05277 [Plasmodium falciparum Dd2]
MEKIKSSEENADDNIMTEKNGKNKSSEENAADNIMTEENGKNKIISGNIDDNIMARKKLEKITILRKIVTITL